tara:strand:- start:92 stop:376 length:285 start_codon:yes stop_codon:yes gene_type:complete
MLKYLNENVKNQKSNLFLKNLKNMHIGDIIDIKHLDKIESYRIIDIQIISLEEALCLDQTNNHHLTFITPYPLNSIGKAPLRLLLKVKKLSLRS